MNFSEAFIAWIHVKALRVFVESVLRKRKLIEKLGTKECLDPLTLHLFIET